MHDTLVRHAIGHPDRALTGFQEFLITMTILDQLLLVAHERVPATASVNGIS
jgi:hypothetical protein